MQRAKIIITGVTAALLLGAACGGTDFNKAVSASNNNGHAVLIAAATQTQAAKSAHISIHASFGGDANVTGDGGIDFEHHSSTFTVDAGPMGQVEQRVVDGVMYMRMGDSKWIKLDLPKNAAGSGTGFSKLDPTKLLDYLRQVSNDVTEVGTETVRGVETTHYRATIDLPGGGSLPIDVWIDDQGYARKATINADVSGSSFSVVFEMYDFGAPVNVEAPPSDQITDPGSGLGGILGGILGG